MDPFRTLRYARRFRNWREIRRAQGARRNPPQLALRSGLRFEAPEDVNAARAVNGVFFKCCYTPPGFEVREGDVVVDVGANIGVFAVYAASQGASRVTAIEPSPSNLEYLRRNLQTNGCRQVRVVSRAVSDRSGVTRLFLGRKGVTHQIFDRDERGPLQQFLEVQSATLEEILDEEATDRVDFLKLDCEGAEGLILGSASPSLLRRIRRLAMEFHDYASPLDHRQLSELLEGHGFETRLRWNGHSSTGFLYAERRDGARAGQGSAVPHST